MTGLLWSSYMCPINRSGSDSQCSAVTELHLSSHVLSLLSLLQYHCSQARGTLVCATLQARQTTGQADSCFSDLSYIMEALYIQPWEEDGVMVKEDERGKSREQEEGGMEASTPASSTTDEETDEDSDQEPPPVIRRKVSFADAFGLNLVSVKEFDNAEVTESEVSLPPERETTCPSEEFYMSCLFTVPLSLEELDQRVQAQMVELESIKLLPGTTTIRGIIRVVNLCYSKSVYVRMSLDRWKSYFELLAEYVPGSSDRKTDRFTFKYTLVPPFEREGTRVEICLRYESSVGTFWANNKEMNYVLFCHQKGHVNEPGPQVQEESASQRSKRSCLRASRRGSAEEKIREISNTSTAVTADATDKADEADRNDVRAEIQSLLHRKERKSLVDRAKSRQRATCLARVQDYLFQRKQHVPQTHSHVSVNDQEHSLPLPTPWSDSASCLQQRQKKQSKENPQVLTYHEIPLLTLDWTLSKASVDKMQNTSSVNDMWDTILNGEDDPTDKEMSVCDVWQAFLNGPSHTDDSGVPESEWLQTATSVSPSNDKDPKPQNVASSQKHEFQVGKDTPTIFYAHTSASCQPLSDTCKTLLANAPSNAAEHQPAEACVSSPGDDNIVTQDSSRRSETNSVMDTPQEFCLKRAAPVSEGSVDSSAECHKHATWEQEREGIIEEAEGIGGDGPLSFVTSSGESETTDMTAMPASQNASVADRISQGARLDEGLSSSREGQVTGTRNNAKDDMLAFRATIRQGTKDEKRFVFSTPGQGVEEGIVNNCMENQASTGEEIFRPQKTEECEISQRYAEEKQCEEFRLNQNSENPLQENESDESETRPAQSHADKFNPNQACEDNYKQSQILGRKFELLESDSKDAASISKDLEVFKKTELEPPCCTTSKETKRPTGAEAGIIQVLNDEAWQDNDNASQLNSSWQRENILIFPEVHKKQSRPIQAMEEQHIQKWEEEDPKLTQIHQNDGLKSGTGEHVLASNQTEEGKRLSRDGIFEEQKEISPSTHTRLTVESRELKKVFHSDQDAFRPLPTDKCNSIPLTVVEMSWAPSQDIMKGQREGVGHEISPEKVTAKEYAAKKDTSTALQRQPETLERTEEDMSHRDKDEGVSTGELKIEALGELMGNVGIPQGERKNAPAQLKEQELSAEVESSPCVEYQKLKEGTKDPITAENTVALEEIESGLEGVFIERFGEDLVRRIWEEVFSLKVQASNTDLTIVDGVVGKLTDIPDITHDCHLVFGKDFDDAFDSGVFSLTELPSDSNSSQGLEQTLETETNECSPKESSQSSITTEQTLLVSQTDLNSSAHNSQDLTPILAIQSRQSWKESSQSLLNDQENYSQIKERSVTHQEADRQTEECVVAHKESFNRSDHPSHKHPSPSSEKLKESNSLVWWSMLYILSHITRLLICALLLAGCFFIVFLSDFPAFFVLYMFSLCWWFYKWKRHRARTNKGMVG
uniref:uncharacterized protein ppp1r3aa isoform X2 n=1 Tax=Scatophagus argus TaxID=75038 RepID=UPI001ED81EE5|nr:uncharacterized protein ppp1r3aa isoform X2 [Scatophagus argus]